jgi:LCP family protein required for cell wall assembly
MDYLTYPHTTQHLRSSSPRRWRRAWRIIGGVVLGIVAAWAVGLIGGPSFTVIREGLSGKVITIGGPASGKESKLPKIADDPEYTMPEQDKNRLDILLLGVRGEGDAANGGMLTDTIMLLSLDTTSGRAVLTSIPRDLTVRVTDAKTDKINSAFIYNGIGGTKRLFSRILGVAIDNVVVVDFNAFKAIVDALGGVTITLEKPFSEPEQWGYEFSLPAGKNDLTGEQTLYYVRSRYGTSDFDRSRRQQQVMLAIKNKIQALDLASDPIRALQLVTTVRKHIQTDLDILDLGTIKQLMQQGNQLDKIKRFQLTTENLLFETKVNGIYELLPRDNTLAHIKEFFRTILTDAPVLATPDPTHISPGSTTLTTTPGPSATP